MTPIADRELLQGVGALQSQYQYASLERLEDLFYERKIEDRLKQLTRDWKLNIAFTNEGGYVLSAEGLKYYEGL